MKNNNFDLKKGIQGKELDQFMESLEKEALKKYKKYNFDKVAKLLEEEADFSHKYAFIGESKCKKFKEIQSQNSYIMNLQSIINENIELASYKHNSSWSIVREECHEIMSNSCGQIVPPYTIRSEFPDGEYSLALDQWTSNWAIDSNQSKSKNKVKIINGLYDLKSVYTAADEIISLINPQRTMYIESFSQVNESLLDICMGT